jgi:CRP-like cAMP-binding protein
MLAQVSQTAACNRMHLLEQRLCRWLLGMQDRVKSGELILTHESISQMLGATRSDVSRAVAALRNLGFLHSSRGKISIQDRKGLESTSCECYSIVKSDYLYPFRAEGS